MCSFFYVCVGLGQVKAQILKVNVLEKLMAKSVEPKGEILIYDDGQVGNGYLSTLSCFALMYWEKPESITTTCVGEWLIDHAASYAMQKSKWDTYQHQ